MRARFGVSASVFALVFAVAAAPASSQQGSLTGTITDAESGVPIAVAAVEILGLSGQGSSALSNASGQFRMQVPAGRYTLVISALGYQTTRQDGVVVSSGSTTTLDISLTSMALLLNPVVVTASRRAEKRTEAPATIFVVGEQQIQERPVTNLVEHLRSAPGVDVVSSGVQSTNVVLRGFNNIFSGSLHALTDNRIVGLPSLRVNLLHFIQATDEDVERMEVVLGPGSALYGPNTANGVLNILTKSPIDYPGTTVSIGGGEQSVFRGSFRSAHRVSEQFGIKVSGQYLNGNEWRFIDPSEAAALAGVQADRPAFVAGLVARGFSTEVANLAADRVGRRNFDIERFSFDARSDWRFDEGSVIAQFGVTDATGVELTGIGAGQIDGWTNSYAQLRFNYDRFFAQTYLNTTDSGDSYLLRDGVPLVDESRMFVAQAQHGLAVGDRLDFTYGFDYFHTEPKTLGTINGINEGDDIVNEYGAYIQTEIGLTDQLKLVLAGRWDSHSEVEDDIYSPRAALVFSPDENQSFRFSYNRAFSPPTSLNLFLDINGGRAPSPLGALGYGIRAQGPNSGFTFRNADGSLKGMRSPFNPAGNGGPGQLLPADVALMWQLAVGVMLAQGAIDPATAGLLASLNPSASDIGINVLNPSTGEALPLALASIPDVKRLKEATTTTFEVGYQGVINNRFVLSVDAWYTKKEDFVSPLVVRTPLLLLNAVSAAGPDIASFLVAAGLPPATAGALAAGMGAIPLGVVSSADVDASGADLLVTYVNAGDLDFWGGDVSFQAFLDDRWTLSGSASFVSEDYFPDATTAALFGIDQKLDNGVAAIALNAPKSKFSLGLAFREPRWGFNAETRMRYSSEFPAESADFVGTACVSNGQGGVFEEDCVESIALVDVTLGYKLPTTNATLQVAISNIFGTPYRSFVGVPNIGRFAMFKVKYDLF